MLDRAFQPPIEHLGLFATVRDDFDLPHHDVRPVGCALHACRERQLEFPNALGLKRKLCTAHAA